MSEGSGTTLETLQVIIEAQTRGFKEEIAKVNREVKRMTNSINSEVSKIKKSFKNMFVGLGIGYGIAKIGQYIKNSTMKAMKVEGAIQQIKRTMGESSNQFLKWANDSALAFNMGKSDAMKYGATYSNLVSGFSGGTKQTLQYTTDLLKASSIIASGTGRTMEDVMERIRSGLLGNTEAIEDLGINVNVAMLQSTEAFRRFANGRSWDQLDFQTQQQIRLFAILEQTSSKFGNEVFNNTNSSLQQLVAVLKDVALNIGNAFMPILNVVLPILTNFAMGLRTVTGYVATFMQVLFGKSSKKTVIPKNNGMNGLTNSAIQGTKAQNGYNKALDKTRKKAKKAAKEVGGLMGFDEINSLNKNKGNDSEPSGGNGAGTSGGSGIPSGGGIIPGLDMGLGEPDTSGIVKAAEKVKAVFRSLADFIRAHKEIIISVIAGMVATIASYFLITKWSKIIFAIKDAFLLAQTAIGVGFLSISWPVLAVATVIGLVVGAIVYLWQTSEEFRGIITSILNDIMAILSRLWNEILVPLGAFLLDFFKTILVPIATFIGKVVVDVVMAAFRVIKSIWDNILSPLANFLIDIFVIVLQGVIDVWNAWKPTINTIFAIVMWIWDSCLKPFVDFIVDVLCVTFENFGNVAKIVFKAVKEIIGGVVDFLVGVFTGDWSRAWEGIKRILREFRDYVFDVLDYIKVLFNRLTAWLYSVFSVDWSKSFGAFGNILNAFMANVRNIWNSIKRIFNGVIEFVKGVFTGNWRRAWQGVKDIFGGIFEGLGALLKAPINAVIGLINAAVDGINSISIDIPDWVPDWAGGGKHFGPSIPKIPYLAKGGVVNSATLAMIGEAGKEAVVPLENNTGWTDKIGSLVANSVLAVMEFSNLGSNKTVVDDRDLVLQIDGTTFARIIAPFNRAEEDRKGGSLIIKTS
ncbi:MAG: hypothetical protein ACRCVJ_12440 [Clostridium sp.]|uniref:hypothetical protein n=1 Tax=Clostridium sp. TaxID=1506 RepID=UPI003F39D31B